MGSKKVQFDRSFNCVILWEVVLAAAEQCGLNGPPIPGMLEISDVSVQYLIHILHLRLPPVTFRS